MEGVVFIHFYGYFAISFQVTSILMDHSIGKGDIMIGARSKVRESLKSYIRNHHHLETTDINTKFYSNLTDSC